MAAMEHLESRGSEVILGLLVCQDRREQLDHQEVMAYQADPDSREPPELWAPREAKGRPGNPAWRHKQANVDPMDQQALRAFRDQQALLE